MQTNLKKYFKVLSIAGSDSSSGAGIQADLKTCFAFHCYCCTVITAVTAQNTHGVHDVFCLPSSVVQAQLDSILSDIGADAVKIGMLGCYETIVNVTNRLDFYRCKNIVLDPVLFSKNKYALLEKEGTDFLLKKLLPLVSVFTPNLQEAEILLNRSIVTKKEREKAALEFVQLGAQAVVLKGGHAEESQTSEDFLLVKNNDLSHTEHWLSGQRVLTQNTHGTGCTFSTAIAAGLALGNSIQDSVTLAKSYITQAILRGAEYSLCGGGRIGPVCH